MLAAHLGYPSISTGDALRAAVSRQTELGKKAQVIMEVGELVPDSLVDELVKTRLMEPDAQVGFILDGYPRTIGQAEFFEKLAGSAGINVCAIGIMVSDEVLVRRLSQRWSCPQCSKIYNEGSNPPRRSGRCDECDSVLIQRKDDRPDVIRERLQVYHQATRPLIDFYRHRGQYVEVNGEAEVDDIFDSMIRILNGDKRNRTAPL